MDPFHPSNLSLDLIHVTLSYLTSRYVLSNLTPVCSSWNSYTNDEILWKLFMERDYGLPRPLVPLCEHLTYHAKQPPFSIQGQPPTAHETDININIAWKAPNTKLVGTVQTFKETWVLWERLHRRIYGQGHAWVTHTQQRWDASDRDPTTFPLENDEQIHIKRIYMKDVKNGKMNTAYFLRAAKAWEKVLAYNAVHLEHLLTQEEDSAVPRSPRLNPGKHWPAQELSKMLTIGTVVSWAVHPKINAFYACVNGQTWMHDEIARHLPFHTAGQLGGFQVYNEYHCNVLSTIQEGLKTAKILKLKKKFPRMHLLPVTYPAALYSSTRLHRFICTCLMSGKMYHFCYLSDDENSFNLTEMRKNKGAEDPLGAARPIDILDWWDEFSRRLGTDCYSVRKIFGDRHPGMNAIDLFPRTSPLMVSSETFGIRVEASTIDLAHPNMGWTYSIRIRIVDMTKLPGYETCKDKETFVGAQLLTRHWKIRNSSTGEINSVDGPGVIGKFPILNETGYINCEQGQARDQAKQKDGWFVYQSMSGSLPNQSTFGGSITFAINRSGNDMQNLGGGGGGGTGGGGGGGIRFEVVVPTFELNQQEYYY